MSFDYRKLRGKIREVCGTQYKFSTAVKLSGASVSAKLNNKVQWSQTEINKACNVLDIPDSEMATYFFTLKV